MRKEYRLRAKAVLSVIGLILLFILLIQGIRMSRVRQPEGETVRVQDALILMNALNGAFSGTDINGELAGCLAGEPDRRLSYGEYERLLSFFHDDGLGLPDLSGKYKEDFFLLESDWYAVYGRLLEHYDTDGTIGRRKAFILGVTEEDGVRRALTEEGERICLSDSFEKSVARNMEVYAKGEEFLTVFREIQEPYVLRNVWVTEVDGERTQIFLNGWELAYHFPGGIPENREQVCDLEFEGGRLSKLRAKREKINGKLLAYQEADEETARTYGVEPGEKCITIEGYGTYACEPDMRLYKLYGEMRQYTDRELRIGYDFTDFVLEDGRICAGLVTREEKMENIRVLVKDTDFSGALHDKVEFTADTGFKVEYGDYGERRTEEFAAGEVVSVDMDSDYVKGERARIIPNALTGRITLSSVKRSQGTPSYRGTMEIFWAKEGLAVVNELLLEEYLYSVVPSEMPASYPGEALKAQAVCARTYAYRNMLHSGLASYGAHVDDSAGYQVYNNIAENVNATRAVRETAGEILTFQDEPAGTFYYSTSCGYGSDTRVWHSGSSEDTSYMRPDRIGEEDDYTAEKMQEEDTFRQFITQVHDGDYESGEGWYRWTYTVKQLNPDILLALLQQRYAVNDKLILTENEEGEFVSLPMDSLGRVRDIRPGRRLPGGCMDELIIETDKRTIKVVSEHNIRYVLNDGVTKVIRQDGSETASPSLLPSAFFVIDVGKKGEDVVGYTLTGGGFGHGAGMSQNGAKAMAAKGMSCEDILGFFYKDCPIKKVYGREAAQ